MCHSQYSDGCLWHQGWGMTHSVCHVITPERLYLSPSAALNVLTEKQQEKETWLEKRFIQTPYPHHSFCRQHCDVSSGFSVCAPTEVQGNYWNIWMTGPSLNPRTNDAWPLQKGMGRTLLPLTDISHQRSMTSPMLVGWREAVRALETRLGKQIWHSWPQKTLFSQPTQRPELMLPMNISPKWQILLISLCPNCMLNFQFYVVTMLYLQSS